MKKFLINEFGKEQGEKIYQQQKKGSIHLLSRVRGKVRGRSKL